MADVSLNGNVNWSVFKASLASGDRVLPSGNYTITMDEAPTLEDLTFDFTGTSSKITLGTPNSYSWPGWIVKAGSASGVTAFYGKAIAGTQAKPCHFYAGAAGGIGATLGTGSALSWGVAHGSATAAAVGISNNGGYLIDCDSFGGGYSGGWGISNAGLILRGNHTGGSVSNTPAIANYGGVYAPTLIAGLGGVALWNAGMALLDVRLLTGVAASRSGTYSTIVLYGGSETNGLSGTAGTLLFVPVAADVRSAKAVLGETGTVTIPSVYDVRSGKGFGAGGTEYVGLMAIIKGDLGVS